MRINRFLGYGRQSVDEEDKKAVLEVLEGDFLTQGKHIEEFETALAQKVKAKHAIAVSSGTSALHIANLAVEREVGGIGVVPTLTFVATSNTLLLSDANVCLSDVDPISLNLCSESLSKICSETNIDTVMPVHFAGLPSDVKAIREIVGDKATIIEDACHALGAKDSNNQPVGSCKHSDMTVFSFHPLKAITTAEGGAVTTNDDHLANKLRILRNQGIEHNCAKFENKQMAFEEDGTLKPWYYEQHMLGLNYRMTDLHAALGLSQLKKLDGFIDRRRSIAKTYDRELRDIEYVSAFQSEKGMRENSGLHLYLLNIDFHALGKNRSIVMMELRELGIGTQVHYIPVHRQPYYEKTGRYPKECFPNSENYYQRALSIPFFPDMSDEEVEYVVENIKKVVR